jgi:type IV fimbrial biogenesis protein FimT
LIAAARQSDERRSCLALKMPAMKSRQAGFTIVELMVTLLVLSILLAAAVPTFRDFTRNNRMVAAQNDLVTAMNVARSEAIKRSADVILCPVLENTTTCTTSTNWTTGWMVRTAADVTPLQVWSAPGGDITATSTASELMYQPIGTVATGATFTIQYPNCTGPRVHQITVLLTGSPQSETHNCPE